MPYEVIVVLVVLVAAVALFITELLAVDLVAIMIMVALILTNVITPEEGLLGFSNPATVTVAAMFVLSNALLKTGMLNGLVPKLALLFRYNMKLGMGMMMGVVAFISAFVNNTPVVAILIPLVIKTSIRARVNAVKFLIPLSFASLFGGVCTVIGTSTNVLVSGMASQSGLEPFSMFQMTPVGIVFCIVGIVYMVTLGTKLLPEREYQANFTDRFNLRTYISEIMIPSGSNMIDKKIMDSSLVEHLDVSVISLQRDGQWHHIPSGDMVLKANDVLKIRCDTDKIKELKEEIGIKIVGTEVGDASISNAQISLVEIVVGQDGGLNGRNIQEIGFKNRFGALVLAIKHRGEILHENLKHTRLMAGDILLIEITKERLEDYKKLEAAGQLPFSLLTEISLPKLNKDRIYPVLVILTAVILLTSLEVISIMTATITGVIFMVLTRCLSISEVYEAIEWKVVFLMAGSISLGFAMQKSGVAHLISDFIIGSFGSLGPIAIISALYLTSSILTEFMSNTASAAILVPITISIAESLGLSPVPFLMTITFAASASFLSPVGYQTNTMVHSAGQYRFIDFIRVGGPLNLIFWIIATFLIPVVYPF